MKINDYVYVRPHQIYIFLDRGATIDPPRITRHNGYRRAQITDFMTDFDETYVEVKINGGFDYVPLKFCTPLE